MLKLIRRVTAGNLLLDKVEMRSGGERRGVGSRSSKEQNNSESLKEKNKKTAAKGHRMKVSANMD